MSELYQRIHDHLTNGRIADNLAPLFCHTLHWGAPRGLPPRALQVGAPVNAPLTAHPVAHLAGLPVYRIDWPEDRLPGVTARRAVQRALKPVHAEHLLCYVTRDQKQAAFVWARQRADGKIELRALPYEVGSPARTTIERLGELAFRLDELGPTGEPPITKVTDKLNRAFDVEQVTGQFFEDYKKIFAELQRQLYDSSRDKQWAHDYALQLLNRLMFLYFIQRKRWLGDNPRFLADFWRAYKDSGQPQDTFFDRWLSVLFFEAFNEKFHGGHRQFPEHIKQALQLAPYLNGGLFARNRLDEAYTVIVPDEFFALLFDRFNGSTPGFFERYNFTITESTPLDIEVAVDPEMIGKVYESLVNITFEGLTEEDLRGAAGIFYTPRVEIDLMCRLGLVDTLANYLGPDNKPLLYDAVFAYDSADKEAADRALAEQNLWPKLNRLLREITVCDPACGSGSFLVGMLLVLNDLQARANAQLGIEETPYERRRRIVGEQLYGVDIMDWAVHVAELRLWLQMVIETELQPAELKFRPLLPNLSFKVRQGDSLVQEIGGINFGLHRHHLDIPAHLKERITQLKGKKLRFYQGEAGLREEDLKREEMAIFRDILMEKRHALQNDIAALTRKIESPPEQGQLPGMERPEQEPSRLVQQWRAEREEKQAELQRIGQALQALSQTQSALPFVWDIAFVEIFEGEKKGFDIVIGNPPYVRQEMIAPPALAPAQFGGENSERWKEQKKSYKVKLQESVAAAWPKFFRYKPGSATFRKPDGKSDLYVYFYLHGLSLLNDKGSFCFITSNSWLDVGYGADLQEFLLKHSHVKLILDNERKRSFSQADVNTIIALLAPPDDRREDGLAKTARFVLFKAPFQEVLTAETLKQIEAVTERLATETFRVTARSQGDLLEEGLVHEEDEEQAAPARKGRKSAGPLIKTARYEANKWGGKYLRMPEFLWRLIIQNKLIPLAKVCKLEYGNKVGLVDFFILSDDRVREFNIEERFLRKIITSTEQITKLVVIPEYVGKYVFVCPLTLKELNQQGYNGAAAYVEWGNRQVTKKKARHTTHEVPWPQIPSVKGNRPEWHCISLKDPGDFIIPLLTRERFFFAANPYGLPDTNMFFHGTFRYYQNARLEVAIINSTIVYLLLEIFGRHNIEGRFNIYGPELRSLPVPNPELFDGSASKELSNCFDILAQRGIMKILDEVLQPDRHAMDDVVFDVLGLTAGEREAVYEAVVNLVRARLEKARSV